MTAVLETAAAAVAAATTNDIRASRSRIIGQNAKQTHCRKKLPLLTTTNSETRQTRQTKHPCSRSRTQPLP